MISPIVNTCLHDFDSLHHLVGRGVIICQTVEGWSPLIIGIFWVLVQFIMKFDMMCSFQRQMHCSMYLFWLHDVLILN